MSEKKIDIHEKVSEKNGLFGFLETLMRRYRTSMYMFFYLIVVSICFLCFSLSFASGFFIYDLVDQVTLNFSGLGRLFFQGIALTLALFLFGITLMFSTIFFNLPVRGRLKKWKGNWYSLEGIPWFYHNAMFYLVRYTILDLITPSPVANFYLSAMGMKIGKGVVINTTNISDPTLITIEDHVTIGGSVTMMAHYGQKGVLCIAPVLIKKGSMIGLKASIFGGVTVEENVFIPPHHPVLPKTHVLKNSFSMDES